LTENRNLMLALLLALIVLLAWDQLFVKPQVAAEAAQRKAAQTTQATAAAAPGAPVPAAAPTVDRSVLVAAPGRVRIQTPTLSGSINLTGARLDDLTLTQYRETIDPKSPHVVLLSPDGAKGAYFAELGWLGNGVRTPGPQTVWTADQATLSPGKPVTLRWDNAQGQLFEITYAVDEQYLFTVTQTVRNQGQGSLVLGAYALLARTGEPKHQQFFVLHEGPLGVINGRLQERSYEDVRKEPKPAEASTGGWIGITDKYWLAALIPDQKAAIKASYKHSGAGDRYQADYLVDPTTLAAGQSVSQTAHLFLGAKRVDLIDRYKAQLNATLFDRAIDWGWFWFLTKPMFLLLHWLYHMLGNFGLAIIALTVIVKAVMFPLANKSYASMNKLKELQPRIKDLQERYKDNPQEMQKALIAIYQKEKISPLGGCLPLIVQMPVFFALYKVLFVSLEMRHQPFVGWIKDLSAADPLTPVNLFGLLPFTPPSFIAIGVLPILMGITMYIQMKLNPQPTDPVQAKVFAFMPLFMTFIMAPFSAGLVLYWTTNNLLTIVQQRWLTFQHGTTPAPQA